MGTPTSRIPEEFPRAFRWHPGWVTDRIDMDFILQEVEGEVRNAVIAAQLETLATLHQTLAQGASKIAGIIRGAQESQK